jgi:hypothetical protein
MSPQLYYGQELILQEFLPTIFFSCAPFILQFFCHSSSVSFTSPAYTKCQDISY